MSGIRISDADARVVAGLHETGAEGIEGTAPTLPGSVDGGLASGILGTILAQLVSDADALALAQEGHQIRLFEQSTQFADIGVGI